VLSAAACGESKPEGSAGGAPAAGGAGPSGARTTISLLVTADENGALLPTTEEG
jgi:hypothetical protein